MDDPNETTDLKASLPSVFSAMLARLQTLGAGVYQTNYTGGFDNCMTREAAFQYYRGFLGPECS
jgi:hypothetical protein